MSNTQKNEWILDASSLFGKKAIVSASRTGQVEGNIVGYRTESSCGLRLMILSNSGTLTDIPYTDVIINK